MVRSIQNFKFPSWVYAFSFALFFLLYSQVYGQPEIIGIIDFYGLDKICKKEVLKVISIKEGDTFSNTERDLLKNKLKTIPGVKQSELTLVCCEDQKRQFILYVGISNKKTISSPYRRSPGGTVRLPEEIIDLYNQFEKALIEGIQKGETSEDRSHGHSLMDYLPGRLIQEKFISYTSTNLLWLKNVLRNSHNARDRAIAAQILAYAADKNQVIDDLLTAVEDANETVRNNATRALSIIASYSYNNPDLNIKKIPVDPFIQLMNSITWTDRNKGAIMLLSLTESREPAILKQIKKTALVPIIEMASWKNRGHAMMGYMLLGRISGFSDEEIFKAFGSEKHDTFLAEMIKKWKKISRLTFI